MEEKYKAAEKLLPWNTKHAVLNGKINAREYDAAHFYYPLESRCGDEVKVSWRLVNCEDASETEMFDHEKLMKLMNTDTLPFESCEVEDGKICFEEEGLSYAYDPVSNTLKAQVSEKEESTSVSPDGKMEVYVKDYNLWLRNSEDQSETQLTFDGEKNYAYGQYAQYSGYITARLKNDPEIPDVLWSPDSRYFLSVRLDQREVKDLYIIQSYDEEGNDSIRPRLHTYKCAFPEDEKVPVAEWILYDVEKNQIIHTDAPKENAGGPLLSRYYRIAKWSEDSSFVYYTHVTRANKTAELIIIHTDGTYETVVHEETDKFLNIRSYGTLDGFGEYCASNYITNDHQLAVWQSERDGFARLYAYDVNTKKLLYPLTPENVIAGALIACDDEKQKIYFYANNLPECSDPYYQLVCSVNYDGTGFVVLTPEDAMHSCTIINDILIDTYSRVDLPPITVLRKTDGTFMKELVKADISDLLARGYVMPERFSVTASDGETELYGILIRPKDFDENKKYPFIDYIYGGMQCYNVPKSFAYQANIAGREVMGGLEEFAQLGFAGIILDGLGTPGRGRKIHDVSYENIHGCAGLADHVYCLKELEEKYPFLDLSKAGMWGNSGGGCATSRAMLEYPDTYKVGVSSAGNHDQRMYNTQWTENYYGRYNKEIYLKGDNTALAKNLKGHLFIVHGAMDDNVAMSQSIRLIDALIREDKDFDFLILPRTNHNVPADPYFIRRKMDYFVRYLLEEEVPAYRFNTPEK